MFGLTTAWLCAAGLAQDSGAEAEYHEGRALFSQGKFADAAARFERALVLSPSTSRYAQWVGRARGLEAERAGIFAKAGLARRSREALEKAVALDPENLGARSDLAAFYAAAPGFMGGGPEKASEQVAEIGKRDPYMGDVRAGDMLEDNDDKAGAEQKFLAALQRDGKRKEAPRRLASLYQDTGRYALAFAQWDAMLKEADGDLQALFGLGKCAALSGQRTAEGEAALRKFLRTVQPEDDIPPPARAHYFLGELAARRGDRPRARAEYEAALKLNPKMDSARKALEKLGR